MNYIQKLMDLIDEAKIKKDISKLFEIKQFIEELLRDAEDYRRKRTSRGKEIDRLKAEIRDLEMPIFQIFSVNRDIHRNTHFRIPNVINKKRK